MIIEYQLTLNIVFLTDFQFTFHLHVTICILVISLEEGLKRLGRDLESRGQLFPLFKPLPTPQGVRPCPTWLAFLCLHVKVLARLAGKIYIKVKNKGIHVFQV